MEQAARKDELYHSNLEQYDYLVSQYYIDPVLVGLFEITNVFYDRITKVFRSVAELKEDQDVRRVVPAGEKQPEPEQQ